VGTLRLLEPNSPSEHHEGEVFSCAYIPESDFVLSGGWDGVLRIWDATEFNVLMALPASPKPLSCCAASPTGQQWYSGTMEGVLTIWDSIAHQPLVSLVAHTRPISAISFSPDGKSLATSSWDRQIILRKVGNEGDGRTFVGHQDIVSGCRFTLDGKRLVSWSHDSTIKLWDLNFSREQATLTAHADRVTALSLSPNGQWAISGSRDNTVRLWDLDQPAELATVNLGAEVRACFFLLDGDSILVADAVGRVFLMSCPTFEIQDQLQAPFRPLCGDLAPSGMQLALGGEDGFVHFIAVDGFENSYLMVAASQNVKPQATMLDRFLGKTRLTRTWTWTCPACRQQSESTALPTQLVACPRCARYLRVHSPQHQLQRS
jgi:WD40 repeat protein